MFFVQKRKVLATTVTGWFTVWESKDGAKCAEYLAQLVSFDKVDEYRIIYRAKECA